MSVDSYDCVSSFGAAKERKKSLNSLENQWMLEPFRSPRFGDIPTPILYSDNDHHHRTNGPQQVSRDIARRRRTRSRSLSFRSSDLKRSQLDRNLMKYEIGVVFSTTVMLEFQ